MDASTNEFPRDAAGLPAVSATPVVDLADGDRYTLRIAPATKRIGEATVRMLSYNGSIPGPTLRVREGAAKHGPMLASRALGRMRGRRPATLSDGQSGSGRSLRLARIRCRECSRRSTGMVLSALGEPSLFSFPARSIRSEEQRAGQSFSP